MVVAGGDTLFEVAELILPAVRHRDFTGDLKFAQGQGDIHAAAAIEDGLLDDRLVPLALRELTDEVLQVPMFFAAAPHGRGCWRFFGAPGRNGQLRRCHRRWNLWRRRLFADLSERLGLPRRPV